MIFSQFLGRLGADPELKKAQSGSEYLQMRVASDDFNRGEQTTQWINVTVMKDKLGNRELKKGSFVNVFGKLTTSAYLTKTGEPKSDIYVFADRIDFVGTASGKTQQNDAVVEKADTGKFEKVEKTTSKKEVDDLPF